MTKICLFQGTFNPIHNAHLKICDYVKENLNFDKILVIPAANPPHKNTDENLSEHRLNMVKLAVKDIDYLEADDIEYKRNDVSYTYPTIKALYEKYPIEGKINFIIGTDAFKNIESWYEADKLKELVDFVLFSRGENDDEKSLQKLREKGYNYKMMNMPFFDVSSTEIRNNVHKSVPIKKLVPREVENYIKSHGLYKN